MFRRSAFPDFWAVIPLLFVSASAFAQAPPEQGPPPQAGSQGDSAQGQMAPDVAGPAVARISLINGDVSVSRGDSATPVAAAINAPVLAADRIATGAGARAEIEFDSANRLRLGNLADARVAEMDNGHVHIEVARGTVSFSVTRDTQVQTEISTPNVSVRPSQRGLYRIWVRDDGQTVVTVRAGEAEIYTQKGTERLGQGQTMFVRGNPQDPEFQVVEASAPDSWDEWNQQRDQSLTQAVSPQYVNPTVTGSEDLDSYGTWSNDPQYGQVWTPRENSDWSPYSAGRWAWEDYYGWTWVSADPWGWAPYHYGNWFHGGLGWSWYPGAIYRPVFWRPALVTFFGYGGGFGLGIGFGGFGGIGWCPLAPFEVFHPWYGRGWFGGGFGFGFGGGFGNHFNVTNVNVTNLYRNARVAGAVRGVSASAFTSGQFRSISRVDAGQLQHAGLVRGAVPLTPSQNNLRYSDRTTSVTSRSFGSSRFTSTRPSAPVQRTSFEQQRQSIQQTTQRYSQRTGAINSPAAGGGQRFGTAANGAASGRSPGMSAPNAASGWSRFGTPNRSATANSYAANSPRGQTATSRSNASWGQFGAPASTQGAARNYGNGASPARSSAPYGSASGNYSRSAGSQGSLGISRPIVRGGAAAQSAPRSSGGSSRPSAPSGGGGHSSGGGRSSGGGGGGHHGR